MLVYNECLLYPRQLKDISRGVRDSPLITTGMQRNFDRDADLRLRTHLGRAHDQRGMLMEVVHAEARGV